MDGFDGNQEQSLEMRRQRLKDLEAELAREKELLNGLSKEEVPLPVMEAEPQYSNFNDSNNVDPGRLFEEMGSGSTDLDQMVTTNNPGQFPGSDEISFEPQETGALEGLHTQAPANEMDALPTPENEVEQYRNEIEQFRSRGYNVSRMYGIFSQEIDMIRQEMLRYMEDITSLKEVQQELDSLDVTGFERNAQSLGSLLKDPDQIEEAKAFLEELKISIDSKDEIERKTKLREIDHLFDEIIGEFSDITSSFDDEIMDIKAAIIDMETAPISEFYNIKKMIYELKEMMIKKKLEKETKYKRDIIISEIDEWEKKGFLLQELKDTVGTELKEGKQLFDEFLKNGERLLEIEGELNSLNIKGFDKELGDIQSLLREPEKLFLVENKLESLKRRIRLAGIQTKMNRLRTPVSQGASEGQMVCPKCGGTVPIPSKERPLKVQCSTCNTEYHLKRVAASESEEKTPNAPSHQHDTSTPPIAPAVGGQPPSQPPIQPPDLGGAIEVKPLEEGPQGSPQQQPAQEGPKCPQCGSNLLPDSVFCGLCGYRLT